MDSSKHSTSGVKLLRYLASEGLKIFTVAQVREAAEQLHVQGNYVVEALHHLHKEGWICRLKRGLYAFTADSGFSSPPHEFEIAMALVNPCAISHWTAMHYHHLTQQVPNKIFAITPTGTPIPHRLTGDFYQFIQLKKEHCFGIEKIWIEQSQVQMTDPERTLLDGLMTPQHCGDFQEVLHAFKIHENKMNVQRAITYALQLDCATIKRLGWVLERLGFNGSLLTPLLEAPINGYRRIDPTSPSVGPYDKKWMIQENIGAA